MAARRHILMAAAFLAAFACGASADTIDLRPWARPPADGAPVTLADIADLAGADAERLGDTVIIPVPAAETDARNELRIPVHRVRAALDGARANWGRLALSGGVCVIRMPRAPEPEIESIAGEAPPTHESIDVSGPRTVRTAVALALGALYGVDAEDLRLLLHADPALLAMDEAGGARRIEARPLASAISARAPVGVTVYEGASVIATATVRADALLRRTAIVVARPVRRGGVIEAADVRAEEVWLAPDEPADPALDAVGATARTRLAPGQVVRPDSLESPIVVRKGDHVIAHCLSGAVAVRAQARAMSDGRVGDMVECRLHQSKKAFVARVDASGRVIMDLDRPLSGPAGSGWNADSTPSGGGR